MSKSFKHFWLFPIATWFSLFFIFPHMPGVTFSGSLGNSILLTLCELLVLILLCFAGAFVGTVTILFKVISKGLARPTKATIYQFFLKWGNWKGLCTVLVLTAAAHAIAWNFVATHSSHLRFDGFVYAVLASAVLCVIQMLLGFVISPRLFTQKAFREQLEARMAEFPADDETKLK